MERENPTPYELRKLRFVADYQLGKGAGQALFPAKGLELTHSRNTGRIRHIFVNDVLIATLRPKNGTFALTPQGGERLLKGVHLRELPIAMVRNDAAQFIQDGGNLFCKHVVSVSPEIRAGDEVIIVDESHRLAGVGKAALSSYEIKDFKVGIAVKVRWGTLEKAATLYPPR